MEDFTGIYRDVEEVRRRIESIIYSCQWILENRTVPDHEVFHVLDGHIKHDLEAALEVIPHDQP